MPVEDIQFLKSNGVKESYIFMIDSKDRDKQIYQTPSEFVVNFEMPFRNVVGMDIIDASIPRTMYNIDVSNNTLAFLIHDTSFDTSTLRESMFTIVKIEPGDYTVQTLIPALNSVLKMQINGSGVQIAITASSVSNPPDIKNLIQFTCPRPFIFNMNQTSSTIAEVLGFDEFPQTTEDSKTNINQRYNTLYIPVSDYASRILKCTATVSDIERELLNSKDPYQVANAKTIANAASVEAITIGPIGINKQIFHSVDIVDYNGAAYTIFNGPRGVIHTYSGLIAQSFSLTSVGYLTKFNVAFSSGTIATWKILSGANISTAVELYTGTIAVSSTDGTLSDSADLNNILQIGTYWLVLVATDCSVYYNDVLNNSIYFKPMLVSQNTITPVYTSLDTNGIYYNMSATIVVSDPYHTIVAPGIYNLVGERYIVLRCPEIEQASFRNLSYTKHTIGLAKFKLGIVGYSENRFDFSTVPLREFHPIGKLTKLTLRYERPNGELYDFKGVNNTLTIALKYYEPVQKEVFQPLLNPNYLEDFSAYRQREEDQEGDSQSEEDGEEYNRDTNFELAWRHAEMEHNN